MDFMFVACGRASFYQMLTNAKLTKNYCNAKKHFNQPLLNLFYRSRTKYMCILMSYTLCATYK